MQEAKNRFDKVQAQAELELQPQVNKAEAEVEKAEPIQHRLRVWTSYQFSLLLAQEGIIEKPQLPDVLRRL